MPTKRTPVHRHTRRQITPEIIEAWRTLMDDPNDKNAYQTVHYGLGLKPWSTNPIFASCHHSPHPDGTMGTITYPAAVELRRELNIAAGLPEDA